MVLKIDHVFYQYQSENIKNKQLAADANPVNGTFTYKIILHFVISGCCLRLFMVRRAQKMRFNLLASVQ